MHDNDYFETSDLSLAAAILAFGATLDSVDSSSPRAVFIFERTRELDAQVQAFWAHQLTVDPLTYYNCLKEAKTRLYSLRRA